MYACIKWQILTGRICERGKHINSMEFVTKIKLDKLANSDERRVDLDLITIQILPAEINIFVMIERNRPQLHNRWVPLWLKINSSDYPCHKIKPDDWEYSIFGSFGKQRDSGSPWWHTHVLFYKSKVSY